MTKAELYDYIRSELGCPYVKVELEDSHLDTAIAKAKGMWTKWAAGTATQEVFFTMVLSGGERQYNLPDGIHEVITMNDSSDNLGTANELFTLQNQMYNAGMLTFGQGNGTLLEYHAGLDYLDMLDRYTVNGFQWSYHKYNNTLTLSPVPSASYNWTNNDTNFMIMRAYMKEGYHLGTDIGNNENAYNEHLYDDPWFQEYCVALSKITLGYIRRKFANGEIMGNSTISLDGDALVQEGRDDKERLEEQLKDDESGDGYPIIAG